MYIESQQNVKIKDWAQLKTRKGRKLQGLFLIEGIRLVHELLASTFTIRAILWDTGTEEIPEDILVAIKNRQIPLYELSCPAFAAVADTVNPQGLMAIAEIPLEVRVPGYNDDTNMSFLVRTEGTSVHVDRGHAMLLDGVQDPGNVGTLIRSADAFEIRNVLVGTGSVDAYAPKVVRASMGGVFRSRIATGSSENLITGWKTMYPKGQVVVASAGALTSCASINFKNPTLLVIGSEAAGVSEIVTTLADVFVKIPMSSAVESLNAGIAGSILLYEAFRSTADLS